MRDEEEIVVVVVVVVEWSGVTGVAENSAQEFTRDSSAPFPVESDKLQAQNTGH